MSRINAEEVAKKNPDILKMQAISFEDSILMIVVIVDCKMRVAVKKIIPGWFKISFCLQQDKVKQGKGGFFALSDLHLNWILVAGAGRIDSMNRDKYGFIATIKN